MVCLTNIQLGQEYCCTANLNLYKTPDCKSLVTQAQAGRPLKVLSVGGDANASALAVCLCDDDYPGWLPATSTADLAPTTSPYQPLQRTAADIAAQMHGVIDFAQAAMHKANTYLWGGTVGPNFDCSGLVQAAFASIGVVLPRDSYQQEKFATPVSLERLKLGDLLFFGEGDRTTHVALYLEDGHYIHSSGKEQGRNGIGIDSIRQLDDPVSKIYFQQLKGAGRVTQSYQPIGQPMTCR
jgi:cell wall-associated NlpC family hydrolase